MSFWELKDKYTPDKWYWNVLIIVVVFIAPMFFIDWDTSQGGKLADLDMKRTIQVMLWIIIDFFVGSILILNILKDFKRFEWFRRISADEHNSDKEFWYRSKDKNGVWGEWYECNIGVCQFQGMNKDTYQNFIKPMLRNNPDDIEVQTVKELNANKIRDKKLKELLKHK